MKIRSITVFTPLQLTDIHAAMKRVAKIAQAAREKLNAKGYEVQTTRVALPPVADWLGNDYSKLPQLAQEIEAAASKAGIDYVSMGPLIHDAKQNAEHVAILPEVIRNTQRVFTSAAIADLSGNLNFDAMKAIASAVLEVSRTSENGFGNLRFAAMAYCGAGIPFFPVAYAETSGVSFAIATESADLALNACRDASSTSDAMKRLTTEVEKHAATIETEMDSVARETQATFTGCDWSLAPHPDASCSIAAAIEALTGAKFGDWGTLTAVAALTRSLRQARVRRVGFSGVFLPVLEDSTLAQRAAEHTYDLQRLVLYSSVCGAGVDTIPLTGDVTKESISALLSDVATLATVLKKPLTVRLMPVPGLSSGEKTRFDFPFLVNTEPLALAGGAPALFRSKLLSLGLI